MKKYFYKLLMPPKAFLFFSLAFILVSSPLILYANSSTSQQSLNYLANFQDLNTGGLKEEYVDEPQTLETDWGIMAFSAWGYDSSTVGSSKSLIDFALSDACALTALTDIERRVLALESAGIDSAQIGCDLAHKIISEIKPSGQIGDGIISSVFGALALSAADQTVSDAAISYIEQNQKSDGGWDSGWGTESNFTAQAIMALASSGKSITSEVIDNAKTYLKNLQTDTGGIKYDGNEWSTESDAFSDAYVLQAIYALGENPDDSYWLNNGKSIVNDLEGFKNEDGSYSFNQTYGKMNPVWTTAIALIGLNQKFLPIGGGNFVVWDEIILPTPTPSSSPAILSTPASTATPLETTNLHATMSTMPTTQLTQPSSAQKTFIAHKETSDALSVGTNLTPTSTVIDANDSKSQGTVLSDTSNQAKIQWKWIVTVIVLSICAGIFGAFIEQKYVKKYHK